MGFAKIRLRSALEVLTTRKGVARKKYNLYIILHRKKFINYKPNNQPQNLYSVHYCAVKTFFILFLSEILS